MDIRNWPMDKIMQLPDHCFGRREMLQLAVDLTGAGSVYSLNPAGLPDKMVIWEVNAAVRAVLASTIHIGLALGEQLPASDAEYNALELVFPNVISSDEDRGEFELCVNSAFSITRIRFPVIAQGRRLIAKFTRHQGNATEGVIAVVFSSIPNEVPSWLCSDHR